MHSSKLYLEREKNLKVLSELEHELFDLQFFEKKKNYQNFGEHIFIDLKENPSFYAGILQFL